MSAQHSAPLALVILSALAGAASAGNDRVVAYSIVDGRTVPASLTGAAGDAQAGRALYFDSERTGCAGCHGSTEEADNGNAPALGGLARRMDAGMLRLWLVAPAVRSPDTAMPGYYTVGQRTDPNDPRFGETRLSAGEIEDLIAYLMGNSATR